MDAPEAVLKRPATQRLRVGPLNVLWLVSPFAYLAMGWVAPVLPELGRALAATGLMLLMPGWLLHLLLYPRTRIGLASRISRAFVLSVAISSFLGLITWFFGGDLPLREVIPPGSEAPPLLGRLSTIIWELMILIFLGAVVLVWRTLGFKRQPAAGDEAPTEAEAAGTGGEGAAGEAAPPPRTESRPLILPGLSAGEAANPVMQRIIREAYRLGDQHKADHPIAPRWTTLVVLGVMMLTGAIFGMYAGGSFGYNSDAPDHLSCIREMVERDQVLPRTTFYRDGDGAAVDARKGFFHVILASMAQLARLDPTQLWHLLPALLIPLTLVVFHTFARRLLRSEGTALFATFLALVCFGQVTRGSFVRLGYGSQLGTVLSWAVLAMALEFVMRPTRRMQLWLIALATFAAVATHLFSAALILFSLGTFLVAMLIFRGWRYRGLRRLGESLLFAVAGCIPALAWRFLFTYAPLNPIHTHRQGILSLGEHLFVLIPQEWTRFLAGAGFGAIILSLFLWRRARDDDAVLYLASLSLAPILIVANPIVVPLLEPYLGYLVARFVLAVPFLMVLAYVARWMGENLLELNSARRVVTSLFFYVFMVWLLFPRLEGFAHSYSTASLEQRHNQSILVWRDLLERMDEQILEPSVILSDPVTNYSIPALTRHYTVSVLHQHGSPSDSLALERLAACRDVLSPYVGAGSKARLCRRFGVDFVLINQELPGPITSFFCNAGGEMVVQQAGALEAEDGLFRQVWSLPERGTLFQVRKENLDALSGIVTPGRHRPPARADEELTREILVRELPKGVIPVVADTVAAVTLMGVELDTTLASRGEHVEASLYWRRVGDPPRFPLNVHLRLETPAPRGPLWTSSLSKIHRNWRQKRDDKAYRMQTQHVPLRGMFGVEHWPMDQFVVDRVRLRIAPYLSPGEYELKVMWLEEPFLPNIPFSHYLSDRDAYDGLTVGRLEVY